MKPDKKDAQAAEKPKVPLKTKENLGNLQKPSILTGAPAPTTASNNFPPFKSGSALPSVSDVGKENYSKPSEQAEEEYYDEEEGSDFDANELLDMTDYKNKRGIPSPSEIANIKPNSANAKASAFPAFNKPAPIATKV